MRHVIALDVGGTGMKAALVGADGTLLYEARRPTDRERGPAAVTAAVLGFAEDLRAYGLRTYGEPAAAAGVAVPGLVDEADGIAVYSANIGWRDVPLRELLAQRLDGVPVALGHDVRTGGLAEGRIGAGKGADRFLFVALGTGIAGAIGIGDRVEATELGHIVVRRKGPDCGCGQRGCLETLASAAAVGRAWATARTAPGAEPAASAAPAAPAGGSAGDAADCAKAVEAGDPRAAAVWEDAVAALADGLLTGLTLLDPRVLIIGGGLAESGDTLLTPLREAVARRVTFQKLPLIVPAALGDTAGRLGAGLLAWDLLSVDVEVTA